MNRRIAPTPVSFLARFRAAARAHRRGLPPALSATRLALALVLSAAAVGPVGAQKPDSAGIANGARVARIELSTERVSVAWNARAALPSYRLLDARGDEVDARVRFLPRSRELDIRGDSVTASAGGEHEILAVVLVPPGYEGEPPYRLITVEAGWPPVTEVDVEVEPGRLYAGTSLRHRATALHADGTARPDADIAWSSSDPSVAIVDEFGIVTARAPGRAVISASFAGVEGSVEHRVAPMAARSVELRLTRLAGRPADAEGAIAARTGDVLAFEAAFHDAAGDALDDMPVTWTFTYSPEEGIPAPGAAAEIRDGRFVGEAPGVYTVMASAGPLVARRTVRLEKRDVVRPVRLVGRGAVRTVHTSDIWPFEGKDGRDYAITGTWGGDGWAYFWDITDPAAPTRVDSLQVDARTVNDVKVSPDGRYAALSREGASNRRNGVVLIDLADPRNPEIASVYDDGLTGGVHNMFATEAHLFALSAGDKYVILDVTDLRNPRYVSEYNHPNSRVHDVWVHDGLAYSSEWGTGVVVVDVGDGRWGGSIENPVFVTSFPVPTGATHAALPYHQEETGKTYLLLGDEIMSRPGMAWAGTDVRIPGPGTAPASTYGYLHVIDFTDPEHPEYVARYEADEFGTHNMWVEDDILYQAYYEGGMRIVDLSGELLGDLRAQNREIAVFKPFDPDGYVANAPMVWGGFTHKGNLFLSDFNSGLWAVQLEPVGKPAT